MAYIRAAVVLFSGADPNEAEVRLHSAIRAAQVEEPDYMLVATYLVQAVRRGEIHIQSSTPFTTLDQPASPE